MNKKKSMIICDNNKNRILLKNKNVNFITLLQECFQELKLFKLKSWIIT